jgi:hypothetical protein
MKEANAVADQEYPVRCQLRRTWYFSRYDDHARYQSESLTQMKKANAIADHEYPVSCQLRRNR